MNETTEATIKAKLDRLAEFHSQKDSIDAAKRAMLDEVKVPAEVLALQDEANKRIQQEESEAHAATARKRAEIMAKLEAIQVPQEVREIFNAVAKQRAEVEAELTQYAEVARSAALLARQVISTETQAKTAQVYDNLAARKRDIEAEFAGKLDAVDANIKALEAEVKQDIIKRAAEKIKEDLEAEDLSIKGAHFHGVYARGRIAWEKKLDKLPRKFAAVVAEIDSFVTMTEELAHLRKMVSEIAQAFMDARKEGEPSVSLRKI